MPEEDPEDVGLAVRLAVRALHAHLAKGRPLASALRDALSRSRAASGAREVAADLCHAAVARRDRFVASLRVCGAGTAEGDWAALMLVAAALRWGPGCAAGPTIEWPARPHLEKLGHEIGLPPVDLRRRFDRLEIASLPPVGIPPSGADDDGTTLATLASFRPELVKRLVLDLGTIVARNLLSSLNEPAPTFLRAADPASAEETISRLAAEGIRARSTGRVPGALIVESGDPRDSDALASGLVEIQDEASQLVASLAAPDVGGRVLDYCAGTGGKSLALASRGGVEVVVHDSDARRLASLDRRAARRELRFARLEPDSADRFDVVLVDAPCSGLGAVRRNPEIRWTMGPDEIAKCAHAQRIIVREAAAWVRPGGRLVYAVCTFTNPETVEVVSAMADTHPDLVPVSPPEWALPFLVRSGGGYSTYPMLWDADVFYTAILRRRGDAVQQ